MVVEVWKSNEWRELSDVTAAGLKALLASPWYLSHIRYGGDWIDYYNVEPLSFNGTSVFHFMACFIVTVQN